MNHRRRRIAGLFGFVIRVGRFQVRLALPSGFPLHPANQPFEDRRILLVGEKIFPGRQKARRRPTHDRHERRLEGQSLGFPGLLSRRERLFHPDHQVPHRRTGGGRLGRAFRHGRQPAENFLGLL